ncbi:MAG TPA: carboxymuconolactone decarboxylase family protein [Rhizomicrobium sp.]
MTARLNPYALASNPVKPLIEFATLIQSRLEPSLAELVKIRASQINGCAICLHMHATEARRKGETEERIFMLDAWRETALYSPRERAALAWTEALTRLAPEGVSDEDYRAVEANFSPEEQMNLTLMIGVINSFNRIGVGYRLGPADFSRKAA